MTARERRVRELTHEAVEFVRGRDRMHAVSTDADIAARYVAEKLLDENDALKLEVNRYARLAAKERSK